MKSFLTFFLLLPTIGLIAQEDASSTSVDTPLSKYGITKKNSIDQKPVVQPVESPLSGIYHNGRSTTVKLDSPDGYVVTTLAGQNIAGNTDGHGPAALLNSPVGVAVDGSGVLYVADATNNKIRKISPSGLVSTIAGKDTPGKKDGPVSEATFYYPAGVAVDTKGNLYVADKGNHKIRKITVAGMVSTLAGSGERNSIDGVSEKASFDKPVAVAVDTAGNVYVADAANNKIRKITAKGMVSTLAGSGELGSQDGPGAAASFYNPCGIAVDATGNVYIADHDNNRIRKITPAGIVSTIAGSDAAGNADGHFTTATFFNPSAVAVDAAGNVYVSDQVNQKIRKLSPNGEVSTLAGTGTPGAVDGSGSTASFNYPSGIAVDLSGNLYIADQLNCKIRKIMPAKKESQ